MSDRVHRKRSLLTAVLKVTSPSRLTQEAKAEAAAKYQTIYPQAYPQLWIIYKIMCFVCFNII
jgi:hypothetical protein